MTASPAARWLWLLPEALRALETRELAVVRLEARLSEGRVDYGTASLLAKARATLGTSLRHRPVWHRGSALRCLRWVDRCRGARVWHLSGRGGVWFPGMSSDPTESFARPRVAAGALFFDERGRVMMVVQTCKDHRGILGGCLERGEVVA